MCMYCFSRYFPLLAKAHPENKELYALPLIYQLLHSHNVSKKVVNMIMDMTENLLTMENFEQTDHVKAIEVTNHIEVENVSSKFIFVLYFTID